MNYKDLPLWLQCEHSFAKITAEIGRNGIQFDKDKAREYYLYLSKELENNAVNLKKLLPPKQKELNPLVNIYNKDGNLKASADFWINKTTNAYKIEGTSLKRWITQEQKLTPNNFRDYLLANGWKPKTDDTAWNFKTTKSMHGKAIKVRDENGSLIKTTPKLPKEDTELDELAKTNPVIKEISKYLWMNHRRNCIHNEKSKKGWVRHIRPDGRIPMGINSCGCNTMRVQHYNVVNIPRVSSKFGSELRSLFCAMPGKVLVGCDIASLEARIQAHYVNDYEFTYQLLHGDIHTFMYDKLKEYISGRSIAKNMLYAMTYGCSDTKLGSMADNCKHTYNKQLGAEIRNVFKQTIPNLDTVISQVKEAFKDKGWIQGLDGRKVYPRSQHSAFNTLCQSAGAIISKYWTVNAYKEIIELYPDAKIIVYMHDEIIFECDEKDARHIGEIMVNSIKLIGKQLKLNIDLDATYLIGNNWSEIH